MGLCVLPHLAWSVLAAHASDFAMPQDPNTGVLEVELPANNPEGWLDHLLTIEEFQLFPEAKPGPTRARTCQAGTLTQQSFQVV